MSSSLKRRPRLCLPPKRRHLKPSIDDLEVRALLSTAAGWAQTTYQVRPLAGAGTVSAPYTPAEMQSAYGFTNVKVNGSQATGSGETIAIVDAYNDLNIQSDLNTFDTNYGLAATTVKVVNETGGSSLPASDPTGGWELEESLDVEWAHAMAPGANIVLVEASSTSETDLFTAVKYAASTANVVSMSWDGSEFSGESSNDSTFVHSGVVFVASSGDSGAPASYPATSPDVLAVGGTSLTIGSGNIWSSETGWSGSGGGPSAYESQPSYQKGVVTQTSTARANPDVAYDANPSTGVAVYDSVETDGSSGWWQVGGTSLGAPSWSGLVAVADQVRAADNEAPLNTTGPTQIMSLLYANEGAFHDITSGSSTGSPGYSAGTGYDYVTGLGSPIANQVVTALAGTTSTTHDTLALSATTTETAGTSFTLTVTAKNSSGATDTGYTGTIHFSSTDTQAGLPANFTFPASDDGKATFSVTLKTAGSQSITATDTANSAVTGTLSGITVSPAAASKLTISGLASTATVGVADSFIVTAYDPYGNVATGYTGTVAISSTDTAATLPASSTFTAGTHTFSVTFGTAGTQSITAKDTKTSTLTATQSGISVAPAAPTGLTATAASGTQINLAWTGSKGATGYIVDESLNGTSGWTQVGTTTTATSFQATGLAAGTTYSFEVIATAGSIQSPASNVATATTTGTPATGDTIWPNSYTPSINAYGYGSYELGVRFTASEAGQVTGVRFFKETWMSGETNVGHLWSSTGTLLATATFTNETGSGWQQVSFSSPVAISANTVYVASFSTGGGYFDATTGFFTASGVTNGPLQAEGTSVGNGVYNSSGSFPSYVDNGVNFWADVAFTPTTTSAPATRLDIRDALGTPLGGSRSMGAMPQFATTHSSSPFASTGSRTTAAVAIGPVATRGPIAQAATVASWVKKSSSPFGLL